MKIRQCLILLVQICVVHVYAQDGLKTTPKPSIKSDYIAFHRMIVGLKEFSEERKSIPDLQKQYKSIVKIKPVIDTNFEDQEDEQRGGDGEKLIGYIRREMNGKYVDLYEITFDRLKKKITAVVPTEDTVEKPLESKITKDTQAVPKKKVTKKKSDDDDDDDDEKPMKKGKDSDED